MAKSEWSFVTLCNDPLHIVGREREPEFSTVHDQVGKRIVGEYAIGRKDTWDMGLVYDGSYSLGCCWTVLSIGGSGFTLRGSFKR